MTEAEAARELRRSPATLTRWRRLRKSPPYVLMHGRILYPRERLHQWIDQQTVVTVRP